MVLDAVSNFVRGETDAAVDSTQTTVSVVDASISPDPSVDGEYNVVIWDAPNHPRPDQDPDVEVLRVTAIDTGTNDLTVTRGQEGTSGAAHPSGSAVHLSPTAKMFGDIESTFGDFWDATAQELTADVNNQSVSTDQLQFGGDDFLGAGQGDQLPAGGGRPVSDPSDTDSNTYESVGEMAGQPVDTANIPAAATLYGRYIARFIAPIGETMDSRPTVITTLGNNSVPLTELEVSGDGSNTAWDSGWTEITTTLSEDIYEPEEIQARISGGTGGSFVFRQVALLFAWRFD